MATARSSSGSLPLLRVRVESFREVTLPRPRSTPSGLFPAVTAPPPTVMTSRLRRMVALAVVIGTVGLLAYVSWQRGAHASRGPVATSRGPAVQLAHADE
ncbi:hypothetical protein [Paraliomyxa miuraensis]|uniref:hypothetical protein n=1 Tax=Paraliomyxa miuraensis TaxID=376150 RepID=UPI002253C1E0|nr:hypothetical protein [Paraliomyxa miuraensis]MCX4239258.1 hypothetical protein [Paraliomyxa miuraensis]